MIFEYWHEWITLVVVFGLGAISPGPDFVMSLKNSLHSRKAGLLTALGFGAGVLVHVTYTILGIATLIAHSTIAFHIIKIIGASYLIYIGVKALRSRGSVHNNAALEDSKKTAMPLSGKQAFYNGFYTNLLNPKASLFFLAIFSQIIGPEMPVLTQFFFGITCVAIVIAWFSAVALFLTVPAVRTQFFRLSRWIEKACGAILIVLGIRLAFSKGATP